MRLHLAAVRLVLGQAVDDGLIVPNLAAGVRAAQAAPDNAETSEAIVLSDEQVDAIITAHPEAWQLLVRVLDGTGLRISEALALGWSDVDFGQGSCMSAVACTGAHRPAEEQVREAARADPLDARSRSLDDAGGDDRRSRVPRSGWRPR